MFNVRNCFLTWFSSFCFRTALLQPRAGHCERMALETFHVTAGQDALLFTSTFMLSPIGLINGIVICYMVLKVIWRKSHSNIYARSATIAAVISVFSSLPNFLVITFISNDAVFPFTFTNRALVHFITSALIGPFIIGKITYYIAFSFHAQSILYQNKDKSPSKFLNYWTCFVSLFVIGCGIWIIYDITNDHEQVAVARSTAMGISYLVPSSSSNEDNDTISMLVLAVDVIYYGVLTRVYIQIIRSLAIQTDGVMKAESIKGLVLMTASSFFFYCTLIVGAVDVFTYIAIQSVDIISDAVCLALIFEEHERAYKWLCGPFDRCCTRWSKMDNPEANLAATQTNTANGGTMGEEKI